MRFQDSFIPDYNESNTPAKACMLEQPDDEVLFLKVAELKKPYKYKENPLRSVRIENSSEMINRSICGY